MLNSNECFDSLRGNIYPVRVDEYTSNWITAVLLMFSSVSNEIADGAPKAVFGAVVEADTEDEDTFYDSIQYQDEEIFVDAVSYQQPTTPLPLSSSSNSHQSPINLAISRKRNNTFDFELPGDLAQSQSLFTEPEGAINLAQKQKRNAVSGAGGLSQFQPSPRNDAQTPKAQTIINKTNKGVISNALAKSRLRQLLNK